MAFQDHFTFFAPTKLAVGRGTIDTIPQAIINRAAKKVLIVTDEGLVKAGLVRKLTDVLEAASLDYALYDGVKENPPVAVVQACVGAYRSEGCDAMVAIGGGSSMDTAKAAGVLASNGGDIESYFGVGKVKERIPYLVCVPTTYGTGSEVTPFAVVTDDEHFKGAIVGPQIIPDVGVLDADMAVALPMAIGAATGMDALTHAIESYTSLGANPISDGLNLHAIQMISENLREAIANDHNHEATERMLMASTVAGIAFSQTRLGNVHAMSHAVSGHHGTPHGVANAIILARVMAYNRMGCPERFGDIAAAMGEDVEGLAPMDAADLAVAAVRDLSRDVGIPETLTEVDVPLEGIPEMAEDAMKSGNIQVNPRKTTLADVTKIFEQCF